MLINNAFRVPSMKPLANTTFDHIRDTIELTVLGALRLIQGFTPALAEAKRLNGERQLDGGPAFATQIGRVQDGQVGAAGDVAVAGQRTRRARHSRELCSARLYLGRHAQGLLPTTRPASTARRSSEIYKAAAVNSDLKRLPTEDEVASAILFMASDLSSGITGQTLDVNCGEYKA